MCDCRTNIKAKVLESFKAKHPDATGHDVDLLNEGINFTTGDVVSYVPIEYRAAFPLKKGGTKLRTIGGSMVFSHCGFCGKKFAPAPSGVEKQA